MYIRKITNISLTHLLDLKIYMYVFVDRCLFFCPFVPFQAIISKVVVLRLKLRLLKYFNTKNLGSDVSQLPAIAIIRKTQPAK